MFELKLNTSDIGPRWSVNTPSSPNQLLPNNDTAQRLPDSPKTQQLVVNDKKKHKENPHEPENVETHHKGFICYQDRWILMFF